MSVFSIGHSFVRVCYTITDWVPQRDGVGEIAPAIRHYAVALTTESLLPYFGFDGHAFAKRFHSLWGESLLEYEQDISVSGSRIPEHPRKE